MRIRCRICGRNQSRSPQYVEKLAKQLGFPSVQAYRMAYLCTICRKVSSKSDAGIRSISTSITSEKLLTLKEVLRIFPNREIISSEEDTSDELDRKNTN